MWFSQRGPNRLNETGPSEGVVPGTCGAGSTVAMLNGNSFLMGGDLVRIFPRIQLAKGKLTYYQGIISLR
jgi:hypothetical protein